MVIEPHEDRCLLKFAKVRASQSKLDSYLLFIFHCDGLCLWVLKQMKFSPMNVQSYNHISFFILTDCIHFSSQSDRDGEIKPLRWNHTYYNR